MTTVEHPNLARLADWVEGRLSAEQAARVGAAVDADAELLASVAWLRDFSDTVAAVPLLTPPPLVAQRMRQYFDRWAQARSLLERPASFSTSALIFDSRVDRPLVATRGEGDDSAYHLAFCSDVADVVLDVRPRPDHLFDLSGQVLPVEDAEPVFEVTALGPGIRLRSVDGDELGRFALAEVPEQTIELRLGNGDIELAVVVDLRPIGP